LEVHQVDFRLALEDLVDEVAPRTRKAETTIVPFLTTALLVAINSPFHPSELYGLTEVGGRRAEQCSAPVLLTPDTRHLAPSFVCTPRRPGIQSTPNRVTPVRRLTDCRILSRTCRYAGCRGAPTLLYRMGCSTPNNRARARRAKTTIVPSSVGVLVATNSLPHLAIDLY
jgi:hypothetical protein